MGNRGRHVATRSFAVALSFLLGAWLATPAGATLRARLTTGVPVEPPAAMVVPGTPDPQSRPARLPGDADAERYVVTLDPDALAALVGQATGTGSDSSGASTDGASKGARGKPQRGDSLHRARRGAEQLLGVAGVRDARPVSDEQVAVLTTLSTGELRDLGLVADVDEVPMAYAFSTPTDAEYDQLWGLSNTGQRLSYGLPSGYYYSLETTPGIDIGFEDAHARASGDGVVVAVIDTGFDLSHHDLAANLWSNTGETCGDGVDNDGNGYVDDCDGWDFYNNDAVPEAGGDTHGTHVAGTILARHDAVGIVGVASDATLMPLKALQAGSGSMSYAAQALRYAVDNGADVVNMSLGSNGNYQPLADAVEHARVNGVTVIAAAGNDGIDIDAAPTYPASYPHANLVSVGAHTATDQRAGFSNYGATNVDVFAPGHMILSAVPGGYDFESGTSMAAPHVAGVAALLAEVNPGWSPEQIAERIKDTATPGAAYVGTSVTGGRLHAGAAVAGAPEKTGLTVDVAGLDDFVAGQANEVQIDAVWHDDAPTSVEPGLRLSLATLYEGSTYGLVEHPLIVGGREDTSGTEGTVGLTASPSLTDSELTSLRGAGLSTAVTTSLPAGRYAMAIELIDMATVSSEDPGTPLAAPAIVTWQASEVGEPDTPGTASPAPSDPGDPSETIDPSAPAPSDPGDSSDPTVILDPGDPLQPGDPSEPGGTSGPGGADEPTAPAPDPTDAGDSPTDPLDPPSPIGGGDDSGTTDPSDPDSPSSPSEPVEPAPDASDPAAPSAPGPGPTENPDEPAPSTTSPERVLGAASQVDPRTGPTTGGTRVTVTRTGLGDVRHIEVGSRAVSVASRDGDTVAFVTPANLPGDYDVTVYTDTQTVVYVDAFSYFPTASRAIGEPFDIDTGLRLIGLAPNHPLASLTIADW